MTAVKVISF